MDYFVEESEEEKSSEEILIADDEEFLGDEALRENGKFRLQNQKYLITYKNHLPKANLELLFIALCDKQGKVGGNKGLKFFRCAHENGHKTGHTYKHTHLLVDFGFNFQSTNHRIFDVSYGDENCHPHIKFIKNAAQWKKSLAYIGKEDPENKDLKEKPSIVEGIWGCQTQSDALVKYCKKPSDASGVIALYGAKPTSNWRHTGDTTLHNWCRDVEDMVIKKRENKLDSCENTEYIPGRWIDGMWVKGSNPTPREEIPSLLNRHINWLWDPVGGNGKTQFQCVMEAKYKDDVCFIQGITQDRDLATVISNKLREGWNGSILFVDMTRQTEFHKIYDSLEKLTNGRMTATKYNGNTLSWNPDHIWIFANYLPRIEAVTEDRWKIWTIDENNLLEPITTGRAKHLRMQEIASKAGEGSDSGATSNGLSPIPVSALVGLQGGLPSWSF